MKKNQNVFIDQIKLETQTVFFENGGIYTSPCSFEENPNLILRQQPRGVDQLSTLNSQLSTSKDPVYSLPAAMSRRIEILSCEVR